MTSASACLYLWQRRTLYVGGVLEAITLTQAAPTWMVSLDKPFSFKLPPSDTLYSANSILMPAGTKVWIDAKETKVANCNLDPLFEDYHQIKRHFEFNIDGVYFSLKNIFRFDSVFKFLLESKPASHEAYDAVQGLFDLESFDEKDQQKRVNSETEKKGKITDDKRIEKVILMIQKTVNANLTVDALADAIGLSENRLMQLFKQVTGVPIRRYRQWHRLYTAGVLLGRGGNLTDAALQAGFTDSSHFSNTFKDMLGMSPANVFLQPGGIKVIPPEVDEVNDR